MKNTPNQRWIGISPWVIVGALIILAPLFALMSMERINAQKRSMFMLLDEKGAALIRSFEAGTRTGMMGMNWSGQQVQRLLMETAQQPDILYILITTSNGIIIAHNKPRFIGWKHGEFPGGDAIGEEMASRILKTADGRAVYEVYRKFIPSDVQRGRRLMSDWFTQHMLPEPPERSDQYIFVGFDLQPLEAVRKSNMRQTILSGIIFLVVGFSGIITILITQHYRITRATLARVQALSDKVVESMPIGLVVIDDNGLITSTNPATERILQFHPGSLTGQAASQALPQEILAVQGLLGEGREVAEQETECRSSQRSLCLEVSASRLRDEGGASLGHLVLLRDISEIKHLKREMERKERLASLGSLAAGIAHEIRNPLSTIKGFATYFKERYHDVPEDLKTAEIMVGEVDRLNHVIGDLLEFARPMKLQPAYVNLAEFMRTSLRMVKSQLEEKAIELELRVHSEEDLVWMDADRMVQVLINMYLNAIEAMETGGRLAVATLGENRSQMKGFAVSDTGHGIAPEDLTHIFDPYFTTKASGTGLGLAIVHKIVEAHGGLIQVESVPEQGTTITVRLPDIQGEREYAET